MPMGASCNSCLNQESDARDQKSKKDKRKQNKKKVKGLMDSQKSTKSQQQQNIQIENEETKEGSQANGKTQDDDLQNQRKSTIKSEFEQSLQTVDSNQIMGREEFQSPKQTRNFEAEPIVEDQNENVDGDAKQKELPKEELRHSLNQINEPEPSVDDPQQQDLLMKLEQRKLGDDFPSKDVVLESRQEQQLDTQPVPLTEKVVEEKRQATFGIAHKKPLEIQIPEVYNEEPKEQIQNEAKDKESLQSLHPLEEKALGKDEGSSQKSQENIKEEKNSYTEAPVDANAHQSDQIDSNDKQELAVQIEHKLSQNQEEIKPDQENDTKFESEIKYDDSDGGIVQTEQDPQLDNLSANKKSMESEPRLSTTKKMMEGEPRLSETFHQVVSPAIEKGSLIQQLEDQENTVSKPSKLIVTYTNTDPAKEQTLSPIEVNPIEEMLKSPLIQSERKDTDTTMFKMHTTRERNDTEMVKMSNHNTYENNDTEMDVLNDKSQFSKASNEIGFDDFRSSKVSNFEVTREDQQNSTDKKPSSAKRTFEANDFKAQFEQFQNQNLRISTAVPEIEAADDKNDEPPLQKKPTSVKEAMLLAKQKQNSRTSIVSNNLRSSMQSDFSGQNELGQPKRPTSVKEAMRLASLKANQNQRASSVGSAQESLFVTAIDSKAQAQGVIQTMDIENEADMFQDLPQKPIAETKKVESVQDDVSNTYSGDSGFLQGDELHRLPEAVTKSNNLVSSYKSQNKDLLSSYNSKRVTDVQVVDDYSSAAGSFQNQIGGQSFDHSQGLNSLKPNNLMKELQSKNLLGENVIEESNDNDDTSNKFDVQEVSKQNDRGLVGSVDKNIKSDPPVQDNNEIEKTDKSRTYSGSQINDYSQASI